MKTQNNKWITIGQKITNFQPYSREYYKQSIYDYSTQKKFFVSPKTQKPISYDQNFDTFQFSCFDIRNLKTQKKDWRLPQPSLGAFLYTEQYQFSCFDIKLCVPSPEQSPAFSNILSFMRSQNQQLERQSQNDIQLQKDKSLAISQIQPCAILSQSKFINFNSFLEEPSPSRIKTYNWENYSNSQNCNLNWSRFFQFDRSNSILSVLELQSHTNIFEDQCVVISQQQLIVYISKMLQGIESDMFSLDYRSRQWKINTNNIRLTQLLKTSLIGFLRTVLQISSYHSQMQIALQYMKKHEYRRVHWQTGKQIYKLLVLMEENILECIESSPTLIEFMLSFEKMKLELKFLHGIIIRPRTNQETKTFFEFDYTFLNSEYIIFHKINKTAHISDSFNYQFSHIVDTLLSAAFRPITSALNQLIFSQFSEIPNKDFIYLQFYINNVKQLTESLGKKMKIIKQQNNELYNICRKRKQIQIIPNSQQLLSYEQEWNKIYNEKKKEILNIKNRYKEQRKQQQRRKQQLKIKYINQLKKKQMESVQSLKKLKRQNRIKNIQQNETLKRQIVERQNKRKLIQLLEKQKEKGYLLEEELQTKKKLVKQRDALLSQAKKLEIYIPNINNNINNQVKNDGIIKSIQIEQKVQKNIQQKQQKQEIKQIIMKQTNIKQIKEGIKKQKRNSKIRKILKNQRQIQQQNGNQQQSNFSQQELSGQSDKQLLISDQEDGKTQNEKSDERINIGTVLEICIDRVIQYQIKIANMCMGYLIYDRYCLFEVLQFMKNIFLGANGQKMRDFIDLSVNKHSQLGLKYFKQSSLLDQSNKIIRSFEPEFYGMKGEQQNANIQYINSNGFIRLFHDKIQLSIGFQFKKMPIPLQPYFTYIHLSKYMQIFSYVLRLKHCQSLMAKAWKQLNTFKYQMMGNKHSHENRILMKLFATRYIIQTFLSTFQNYLFFRVIEKQFKNLRNKLIDRNQMNQISVMHLKMLDNIMKNGFISNPNNDVSKKMKDIFGKIRDFKNIVDMFCIDDVPTYLRQEVQTKVDQMYRIFRKHQQWFHKVFLTV